MIGKPLDWLITAVFLTVILGTMGTLEKIDAEKSAEVLADAKEQARKEAKQKHTDEYASLDEKSRYYTAFDQIADNTKSK